MTEHELPRRDMDGVVHGLFAGGCARGARLSEAVINAGADGLMSLDAGGFRF